jgi:hypothetical protein
MSLSAFGVDHGEVYKAGDKEKAKHYGRMSAATGAVGGLSTAVAGGAGAIGLAEHRGHDPMGVTRRGDHMAKPVSPAARARLLKIPTKIHTKQAIAGGAVGLTSLGLSGAYHHKKKQELAKFDRKKAGDAALGTGAVGVAGGTGYVAAKHTRHMAHDAKVWHTNVKDAEGWIGSAQRLKLKPAHVEFWNKYKKAAKVTSRVKGAGVVGGVAAAGAGAAGVAEMARYHGKKAMANRKRP